MAGHRTRRPAQARTTSTSHQTTNATLIVKVRLSTSHSADMRHTLSPRGCILAGVVDYISTGKRPVIVKARAGWTTGELVSWWRRPCGWVGQVNWRTGAPDHSTAQDKLPAAVVADGRACSDCLVRRAWYVERWLAEMASASN